MKNQDCPVNNFSDKLSEDIGLIHVKHISECGSHVNFQRDDLYKIALSHGNGIVRFADKEVVLDQPAILFVNPLTSFSWEKTADEQNIWMCLFGEELIQNKAFFMPSKNHPFQIGFDPVHFPSDQTLRETVYLFERINEELSSDYIYKYEAACSYLNLLIHLYIKSGKNEDIHSYESNAALRITMQFLEILEKQFPVISPMIPLKNRSAQDYADQLFIHVNHLNHSVKEVTGKTSSQHIINRVVKEAKALLYNTNWSISEISYALGFEYSSHFTSFIRKNIGVTPSEIRKNNI